MAKPDFDQLDEIGSPEFVEPSSENALPATGAQAPQVEEASTSGHLSKDSLGYYLQPFIMYALLIVYLVILTGLILQGINHQENQITIGFWKFVRVVNEFLLAWTAE